MSKNAKVMIVIMILAAAALAAVYFVGVKRYESRFLPGTEINGVDCAGMTVDEVKEEMQEQLSNYRLAIIEQESKEEYITGEQLNLIYEDNGVIDELIEAQNTKLWFISSAAERQYRVDSAYRYDRAIVEKLVDDLNCMKAENMVPSQNAGIELVDGKFVITPEIIGTQLEKETLVGAIEECVLTGKTRLDLLKEKIYTAPEVLSDTPALVKEAADLNTILSASVTYDLADRKYTVNKDTLLGWFVKNERGTYTFDTSQVSNWVRTMASETDTFGLEHEFKTSIGPTIQLAKGGDYGWVIDQSSTTSKLLALLQAGQNVQIIPDYLYTATDRTVNDIGGTYVEVCITMQHMWVYKDGQLVVDTDVVTGNQGSGFSTPSGSVWAIDAKKTDMDFTHFPVSAKYWLPFNGECGLHDSSWRDSYGGSIYLTDGSHGCVNTPLDAMAKLYDVMEIGYPVIIYYSVDQPVGPQPTETLEMG